ncbi:hypothetical protein D3C76_1536310 [compost metagenome]
MRMLFALADGGVERLHRGGQFMVGMLVAIGGEKELRIADVTTPATELGGFVMAQGYPEGVVGQLLQTLRVDLRRGGQRGADTQRQPGKTFEHKWQLKSKRNKDPARRETLVL